MARPLSKIWRVALIDSCGTWPGAIDAAEFVSADKLVQMRSAKPDPTGHGSRIASLLVSECELVLAQVLGTAQRATAAAVAAAVDWSVTKEADLLHMSIGVPADRALLAEAIRRADAVGCIIVASTPARGELVYPAAYPEVIRGTGDARCASGEISVLGDGLFGGCPRLAQGGTAREGAQPGAAGEVRPGVGAGASAGAAWVTKHIIAGPKLARAELVASLGMRARFHGREHKTGE